MRSAKAVEPRGRCARTSSARPPTNAQTSPASTPMAIVTMTARTSTGWGWAEPILRYGMTVSSMRAVTTAPTAASSRVIGRVVSSAERPEEVPRPPARLVDRDQFGGDVSAEYPTDLQNGQRSARSRTNGNPGPRGVSRETGTSNADAFHVKQEPLCCLNADTGTDDGKAS